MMNIIKFSAVLFSLFLLFSYWPTDNDHDYDYEVTKQIAPDEFNSEVIVSWFNLKKTLTTETPGYTLPVAARAFGYTGDAL